MKLGRNMELVPGIARIPSPWYQGVTVCIQNGLLVIGKSRPSKNGRQSDWWPQNTENAKNPRPATLGASPGFDTFVGFLRLGSQKNPAIPPLNKAIIPWRLLGYTILVLEAVFRFRFKSRMQPCIQSQAEVKKRILSLKLTQPLLLIHCRQNKLSVKQATMRLYELTNYYLLPCCNYYVK